MAQGKRTDLETKALIIERLINWDLWSDIAKDIWVDEATVSRIKNNDLLKNEVLRGKYQETIDLIWFNDIKWDKNLNIDKDIFLEYLAHIWWYREAKEYIEWFMLQSLWKSYIRRKAINSNIRYAILEKSWFKCQACWEKPNSNNDVTLEIDHIIPHSMWWLSVENNYQVLCMKCNVSKWNKFIYNHNENEG